MSTRDHHTRGWNWKDPFGLNRSIRAQMTGAIAGVIMIVMGLALGLFFHRARALQEEQLEHSLIALAGVSALSIPTDMIEADPHLLSLPRRKDFQALLSNISDLSPDIVRAHLFYGVDKGTRFIADSDNTTNENISASVLQQIHQHWHSAPLVFKVSTNVSGEGRYYACAPVLGYNQSPLAVLILEVIPLRLQTAYTLLMYAALFMLLFGVLLSVVFAWFLAHHYYEPINTMIAAIRTVEAGDLRAPITMEREDEFQVMADAFQSMKAKLAEHQEKLEQSNAHLQVEVNETSAHLQTAHRSMQATEKLVALGTLSSGVAHQFNNLFQIVLAWTDALDQSGDASSVTRGAVRALREVIHRAQLITQGLLTFTQTTPITTSGGVLWEQIVKICLRLLETDFARQGIVIVTHIPSDVSPVQGNHSQLIKVLVHLLNNAKEAMEGGPGTIRISVEVVAEQQEILRVSDDGCGIKPEDLPFVFNPFFSRKDVLSENATEPQGHMGLGLSVVRGICTGFGGDVMIEKSEPQVGTVMAVVLPVAESVDDTLPQEFPSNDEQLPFASPAAMQILVVDDEEEIVEVVSDLLELEGYFVDRATNSNEALEMLARNTYHLLITDVVMPEMPGSELIRLAAPQYPDLRFIVMSGFSPAHLAQDFDHPHIVSFLPKPFSPQELIEQVDRLWVQYFKQKNTSMS